MTTTPPVPVPAAPYAAPLAVRDAAEMSSDAVLWPELSPEGPAGGLVVVDLDDAAGAPAEVVAAAAARIAVSDRVVVGVTADARAAPRLDALLEALTFTVTGSAALAAADRRCVHADDPGAAVAAVAANTAASPQASLVLCQVLAVTAAEPVRAGLRVESLAYSTLMAGPEFRAWLAARRPRRPAQPGRDLVRADRDGDVLTITLDDPSRRNAYSAAMREALLDALAVATLDTSVRRVVLRGAGPAFCSGGDLAEFGTGPGGSMAHFIRTQRAPGIQVHRLRGRVRAELHGACVGAGIELPAFAGRVVAHADTTVMLPEIAMGLIPGAGGTVSITRRVGRWRSAYLALSGRRIGAATALAWGLVDEIAD